MTNFEKLLNRELTPNDAIMQKIRDNISPTDQERQALKNLTLTSDGAQWYLYHNPEKDELISKLLGVVKKRNAHIKALKESIDKLKRPVTLEFKESAGAVNTFINKLLGGQKL